MAEEDLREYPVIRCPVCGKEAESFYIDQRNDEILGCEHCVECRDAYEWMQDHAEDPM